MKTADKRYRIGCQSWGYDDWVTRADGPTIFYPRGTRKEDMLTEYARLLDTVEIDSTAYGTPQETTFEGWTEKAGPDFRFSLKVPRLVTHDYSLDFRSRKLMDEFCERSRLLGDRLGVILLQFPASFESTKENGRRFREFIAKLPPDLRFAAEFREPGWFVDWTFEELEELRIAMALVEGPWIDRGVMLEAAARPTAPHAYARFMGKRDLEFFDRVQRPQDEAIEIWAGELKGLVADDVYIYADNQYEGHAPATVNKLRSALGLPQVDASAIESQASLF